MTRLAIVTGAHKWKDRSLVEQALDAYAPDLVFHSGEEGADAMASAWCDQHGVKQVEFQGSLDIYGRAAGRRRNQRMVNTAAGLSFGTGAYEVRGFVFPLSESHGPWDCARRMQAQHISYDVIRPAGWRAPEPR